MSHVAVINAFPRRPIALIADPKAGGKRLLWLAVILLCFLPGLYWAWILQSSAGLKQDLLDRGVVAEVLRAEGTCFSRRQITGNAPRGCDYEVEYRLRPEDGGGTRTADVRLDGTRPVVTPELLYDPQNPDRAMFRPEMERSRRWQEWIGVPLMLIFPIGGLIIWFLLRKDGWAEALADPRPAALPVSRLVRLNKGMQVWYYPEPGGKEQVQGFREGSTPFLLHNPNGNPDDPPYVLALRHPVGRYLLLDREMPRLALTAEERARLSANG